MFCFNAVKTRIMQRSLPAIDIDTSTTYWCQRQLHRYLQLSWHWSHLRHNIPVCALWCSGEADKGQSHSIFSQDYSLQQRTFGALRCPLHQYQKEPVVVTSFCYNVTQLIKYSKSNMRSLTAPSEEYRLDAVGRKISFIFFELLTGKLLRCNAQIQLCSQVWSLRKNISQTCTERNLTPQTAARTLATSLALRRYSWLKYLGLVPDWHKLKEDFPFDGSDHFRKKTEKTLRIKTKRVVGYLGGFPSSSQQTDSIDVALTVLVHKSSADPENCWFIFHCTQTCFPNNKGGFFIWIQRCFICLCGLSFLDRLCSEG